MYICAVYLYKWLVCCSQKISINQVQKRKRKKKTSNFNDQYKHTMSGGHKYTFG